MHQPTARLIIMARAPRFGTVKSRLAATVGEQRALTIYRTMAEQTVASARESGLGTTIAFTPGDAVAEMRDWLGDDLDFAPQAEGDLGHRMATAMTQQLAGGAACVVVIGTDCPGLTAATVHAALARLHAADVVYGPAGDGGFYLVAARAAHPALFSDIPWSTGETLATSLARAAAAGLSVALLPELRDVDTEEDWQWYTRRHAAAREGA